MASLLIRNVDDALHARLKLRARANQRSLEEEARETLRSAMARDSGAETAIDVVGLFAAHFGPERGIDLELRPRNAGHDRPPPDFSGPEFDR